MFGLISKAMAVPGRRDALAEILLEGTRDLPGCLSFVVAFDRKDDDAIWITEVWESAALHQAALALPSVRAAVAKGRPLIARFVDRFETAPLGGCGLTAS